MRKPISLMLAIIIICIMCNCDICQAKNGGQCGDNANWSLDDDGNLTIFGYGKMYEYESTIPADHVVPWNEKSVKTLVISEGIESIGCNSFSSCSNLTSVSLPGSLKNIGDHAFFNCTSLSSIIIPDGVTTIEESAFSYTGLKYIKIPKSVTKIRDDEDFDPAIGFFAGCRSLSEIEVDSENPEYTSQDGILYNKQKTSLLKYPCTKTNSVFSIPESVQEIFMGAFSYCENLTEITIPNSVSSIGSSAFWLCKNILSIELPDNITHIQNYAFMDCVNLNTIHLPTKLIRISESAFENCINLKELCLPNDLQEILSYAFAGCSSIESINIPRFSYKIGPYAFKDCESLKYVNLSESCFAVNKGLFENCKNLESIVVPKYVSDIDTSAFKGCNTLKEIKVLDTNISFTDINGVLFNKTGTELLLCPENYEQTTYEIPEQTTTIKKNAFSYCKNIATINSNNISSMETNVFEGCSNLSKISLSANLDTINKYTFRDCINLKSIQIPNSITTIKSYAFEGCVNLSKIQISKNISEIQSYAFSSCNKLSTIIFEGNKSDLLDRIEKGGNESLIQCLTDNHNYPLNIEYSLIIDDTVRLSIISNRTTETILSTACYSNGKLMFLNFDNTQRNNLEYEFPINEWNNFDSIKIIAFGSNTLNPLCRSVDIK